jgi:hypothetical protein
VLPSANTGYTLPVSSSLFAAHPDWLTNTVAGAPAAELPVAAGTPVVAVTDGTVTAAGNGQVVVAGTDAANYSLVGVAATVAAGTKVTSGDRLATASGVVRFAIEVPDVAGPVCPQQALTAWSAGNVIEVHALANQGLRSRPDGCSNTLAARL